MTEVSVETCFVNCRVVVFFKILSRSRAPYNVIMASQHPYQLCFKFIILLNYWNKLFLDLWWNKSAWCTFAVVVVLKCRCFCTYNPLFFPIWHQKMFRNSFVDISCSEKRTPLEHREWSSTKNYEVRVADNVQGQNTCKTRSYVQLKMAAIVFIILIVLSLNGSFNIFLNTSDCGISIGYSPHLAGRIQSRDAFTLIAWKRKYLMN